jgi:hypothetical protein
MIEVPTFPNNPFVDVANRADLGGRRVVALDVPGQRFRVVDRFTNRAIYLQRAYRSFNDFLGHIEIDRVPLTVVHGPSVDVQLRGSNAQAAYVRIGSQTRLLPPSTTTIDVRPSDLPADGSSVPIAFGIVDDPRPRPGDAGGDDESWIECRTDARAVLNEVQVVSPCDGFNHFVFPNGERATEREDVSPRLQVVMSGM